jgi:phosphoribosyl-AMP cyclohydrolase
MQMNNFNIDKLFVKSGLIPVIIQDVKTNQVLMLAYMNRESLEKTLETKQTWFWSRSQGKLWRKGETSGHTQHVISVHADCDDDTLLIVAEQTGPACHTGEHSCFFNQIM